MKKITLLSVIAASLLLVGCVGGEKSDANKTTDTISDASSKIVEAAKKAGHTAVEKGKEVSGDVAEVSKRAAHTVVEASKDTAHKVAEVAGEAKDATIKAIDSK